MQKNSAMPASNTPTRNFEAKVREIYLAGAGGSYHIPLLVTIAVISVGLAIKSALLPY